MAVNDQAWTDLLRKVRDGLKVSTHSGRVQPGEVFVALPGSRVDGASYIAEAVAQGAGYVVSREKAGPDVMAEAVHVQCLDPHAALGQLAAAHFGTDQHCPRLVGVTGTNGKTTVVHLVEYLAASHGMRVGTIGTIGMKWGENSLDAGMTTPDCWTLHQALAQMREDGVELVCMEVSSHALAQQRTAGLDFEVAVWTNLSQDHLDYHQDMEDYFQAKARLFAPGEPSPRHRVINIDDAYGHRLHARCKGLAYSLEAGQGRQGQTDDALLQGQVRACTRKGLELTMELGGQTWELHSGLVGRYNAANLLAAQGAGLSLGLRPRDLSVLEGFAGVPGRLERVGNTQELDIFVDYAHTPDALENVLSTLRALCRQRLIVVFGCGGDRDRSKRALMGHAVCRWADMAVLTSDNPRHEKPEAIMDDVRPGLLGCARVISEVDRRQAIGISLEWMRAGDVLLVAGKGHERTQQIGETILNFHDPTVIREMLDQVRPKVRSGVHGCG